MDKYTVAKIGIHGAKVTVLESNDITMGLTGAVVQLIYDDDLWQGMRKKVTFRGTKKVDVLTDENVVELPWEVTTAKNVTVSIGITGVDAGEKTIIPTVWATIGAVKDSPYGAYPVPGEPVPPEWAQVLKMIGDLRNLNTVDKSNLVAAVNEAMSKSGGGNGDGAGGYYTPIVTQPTANTMQISFTPSVATMPAVEPVTITLPGSDSGGNANCLLTIETITIGEPGNIPVTGITLDYSTISLDVGDSMMLAASVTPSNATNNVVLWESSNPSIAKVENGFVTAVASGNCTITAKSAENNSIKATCSVAVAAESGGDEPGGETGGTVTVLYRNIGIVEGSLAKKDGTIAAISSGMYVEFPYYEDMMVSTLSNSNWYTNYPPIAVYTNGAYNSVDYTDGGLVSGAKHYTATLKGYPAGSVVRVNIYTGTSAIETADEYLYYSYES